VLSKPPLKAANSLAVASGPIDDPESATTVAVPRGGSLLPTCRPKLTRPARKRNTVTTCPVGSVTDWVSTAIAPPTVDTGVHPGCSVVDVVVGATVVVGAVAVDVDAPAAEEERAPC
jgi:hypothetical protein